MNEMIKRCIYSFRGSEFENGDVIMMCISCEF